MSSAVHPSLHHSQNFLKDARLVASLLDRSSIRHDDVVYEIGPGKGIITEQLARSCARVVAIEKDRHLAAWLLRRFAAMPQVTVHQGDFLSYRLPRTPYKVFANIPFNITAAVVTKLTAEGCAPEDAYLVMQREAADMWLGRPHESLRTVLLKSWFELEVVHRFRRTDFLPAPRVDVVMLRLRKRGPPLVARADRQCFRDFVVYGFTTWQQSLGDILKDVLTRPQLKRIQRELDIDLDGTPTMLPFERWLDLFERFQKLANEQAFRQVLGSERRLTQQQARLTKVHRTRAMPWLAGRG
jgi:23S rRNA (adenine-N6)-dimethyltransferase